MPVDYEDWLDVRACAFSHPGAQLFFRTSYGKKHGTVKIHISRREKSTTRLQKVVADQKIGAFDHFLIIA